MKLRNILLLVSALLAVGCSNIQNLTFKQSEAVTCDYEPISYTLFSHDGDGQLKVLDQCERFNKANAVRSLRLNVANHNDVDSLECNITYSEFNRTIYLEKNSDVDLLLWFHTKAGEKPKFYCNEYLEISSLF
tara:strand:- start:40 stop:438 length:399 start_codon:yes stop_codon:yes gene_type:complete